MENKHRTKRLGIFTFYDASGIVDRYVQELLLGILSELDKLVIIVNGTITDISERILKKYSDAVFVRENIGFDAGGYKDAFTNFLTDEDWEQWEEVVLFNDTFYGPIFPWEPIFEKMEKEEVDFWGLSRYPGRDFGIVEAEYPSHVQSYFLVCRKKLICSPLFRQFWNELEYPMERSGATRDYEVRFTTYFEKKGFGWKVYTDICEKHVNMNHGGSPYIYYAFELLSELQFPVIKRNALTITNFIKAKQALDFIVENTTYDVDLIYSHLNRLAKEDRIKLFNPLTLELFYHMHSRIFIYGHGEYGKNIAAFFDYRGWKYEGFLVSIKTESDVNVFVYRDVEFSIGDGIILALGKKAFEEVGPVVKEKLSDSQLFLPY